MPEHVYLGAVSVGEGRAEVALSTGPRGAYIPSLLTVTDGKHHELSIAKLQYPNDPDSRKR